MIFAQFVGLIVDQDFEFTCVKESVCLPHPLIFMLWDEANTLFPGESSTLAAQIEVSGFALMVDDDTCFSLHEHNLIFFMIFGKTS